MKESKLHGGRKRSVANVVSTCRAPPPTRDLSPVESSRASPDPLQRQLNCVHRRNLRARYGIINQKQSVEGDDSAGAKNADMYGYERPPMNKSELKKQRELEQIEQREAFHDWLTSSEEESPRKTVRSLEET